MPGAKHQFSVKGNGFTYEAMSLKVYENVLQEVASGNSVPINTLEEIVKKYTTVDFESAPYFITALAILNVIAVSGLGEIDVVLNCEVAECAKAATFNAGDCRLNKEDYALESVIKVSPVLALVISPASFTNYMKISNGEYGSCEILASFCNSIIVKSENGTEQTTFGSFKDAVAFFENDFPAGLDMAAVMSTIYGYPDVIVEVKDCKKCDSKKALVGFSEIFF